MADLRLRLRKEATLPVVDGGGEMVVIGSLTCTVRCCLLPHQQLEELIGKMRECKRLIKEFDREVKDLKHTVGPDTSKILNEKKQSMVKELNSYVALKKQYASNIENKRVDLFGGPGEGFEEDNGLLASSMTNQQVMDNCHHMMDETDQTIERSENVVHETVTVGTETAATLKAQVASLLHDDVPDDVDTRCDIANSDRGRASSCWENNANEHVDDQDGIKDGERVLLCLKHALRIANPAQQMANVARGSSEPVTLFDEILNNGAILGLIELIKTEMQIDTTTLDQNSDAFL
ncbi:hypothetical protein LXL04_000233 [Taraxacum kok-saghyz]